MLACFRVRCLEVLLRDGARLRTTGTGRRTAGTLSGPGLGLRLLGTGVRGAVGAWNTLFQTIAMPLGIGAGGY